MLEQQMQELRELPARVSGVESQILQLRQEMRVEFSAVRSELRGEIHGEIHKLRGELHQVRDELREDIRIGVEESQNLAKLLHAAAIQGTAALRQDVLARLDVLRDELRADIRSGNEETRTLMRAFFERGRKR